MRQIGEPLSEPEARRFADFLVAEGIEAHAESEANGWAVWVRNEDQVDQAKNELTHFLKDPTAQKYRDAEKRAQQKRRKKEEKQAKAAKNIVDVRSRWPNSGRRKAPITIGLIVTCIVVTLATGTIFSRQPTSTGRKIQNALSFVSYQDYMQATGDQIFVDGYSPNSLMAVTASLRKGEIWRLVTSVFPHANLMHLLFNCLVLWVLGSQIENRKGKLRYVVMLLIFAVISCFAQSWLDSPFALGFSGVNYGLFGYIWMRQSCAPQDGLYVSPVNVFIFMGWFFLCWTAWSPVPNVANVAHAGGLLSGIVWGLAPLLWRK